MEVAFFLLLLYNSYNYGGDDSYGNQRCCYKSFAKVP